VVTQMGLKVMLPPGTSRTYLSPPKLRLDELINYPNTDSLVTGLSFCVTSFDNMALRQRDLSRESTESGSTHL
jgi:uncharacterized membrane protein YagU involved in acid resistance